MIPVIKCTEHEGTWSVDPDKLPKSVTSQQPHIFVTGYRDYRNSSDPRKDREESVRYIGSSRQGYRRLKEINYTGTRKKEVRQLGLLEAEKLVRKSPTVSLKFRRIFEIDGRKWLVDYLPMEDSWRAETEFESPDDLAAYRKKPELWPDFVTDDFTESPSGYMRNHTRKVRTAQLEEWFNMSKLAGNKDKYTGFSGVTK